MYEIFLEKNINSIRQTVDDAFISKYADLSYPELFSCRAREYL
jgi:hypothetical protein